MPSSPGPREYARTPQRFFYKGISLMPQDALPAGKHAWALNIRSHEEGTIEPRYGLDLLTTGGALGAPAPIHSLFRLNDPTPYATTTARRFLGVGTSLYANIPGSATFSVTDTGYSGDPLSILAAAPFASPRPYAYIADSDRQRKIDTDLADYSIGIPQPTDPPSAALAAIQTTFLESVDVGTAWIGYAAGDTGGGAPLPVVSRCNTVITNIVYDDGGTDGMCSFAVADPTGIIPGATVAIGPSQETVIIQEVLPPIASTTIAAILYDSGNTGLCTIQPTGSFSAGQIELPDPAQIRQRYSVSGQPRQSAADVGLSQWAKSMVKYAKELAAAKADAARQERSVSDPAPPPVTITRTVDFPVNALVLINGVEVVRILSIAIGPDGVQSFRCSTLGTFSAGQSISGLGTLRAYSVTTFAVGHAVVASAIEQTWTPGSTAEFILGTQAQMTGAGGRNWALVGNRAVQPEDIIRFGIKVNLLGYVKSVRLVLGLTNSDPTFVREYYFYEWRAADLVSAIQATSESVTGLVKDAQRDAVEQGQIDTMYGEQYGQQKAFGLSLPISANLSAQRQADGRSGGISNWARTVRQHALARMAPVSTGATVSRQLALGNDAWITLECRVGDLTRVGTDTTLTLGSVARAAIYLQVEGTTDALTFDWSDCYLTGGYGPDVGQTLPPYVYCYSYRSTITGERSNPSPPMRAGVLPHRGRVELTAPVSTEAQVDQIDFWRFGGVLARWVYVGSCENDPTASPAVATYTDDMADDRIDGGESPRVDFYQPWPVADLPRSGTCTVAGTAIEWTSGDVFNTQWAPNSLILVNGIATMLYGSPSSTTRLEVTDNVGSGTNIEFSLPSPTLLSQNLPTLFGGSLSGAWFHFAVGNANDPGSISWTHANNPDCASDASVLTVTAASEPLQNGYIEDGIPYVFSTEKLYALLPNPGGLNMFVVKETMCDRGLWSRWAFAVDPNGSGTYFLGKDGIYRTSKGSPAVSITKPDLQPLFPLEGSAMEAIRNLNPVDMTATSSLKLSFVGTYLFFDYLDTQGEYHTLVYEPLYDRWTPDEYIAGATARYEEPGDGVLTHLIGHSDGNLRQYTSDKITDEETDINWALWTPWANGDDPRNWKQWGDAILDFNPGGSVNGISVTPVVDNGNVALEENLLGAGDSVRDTYLVEVGATGASPPDVGYGVISRNCGLWIEGAVQACDIQRPLLYLWEPAFLPKGHSVARRATDWEDLGYRGAKFVQGVVIRANTFGVNKTLQVQYDGPNNNPQVGLEFDINHDGEQTIAYPLSADGWDPFIAELVRLQGIDEFDWVLLDWRFIWEPAPELATQWETQYTTHDLPGFLTVHDGIIAYQSTADVTWFVEYQDGFTATYTLTNSAGAYRRIRQICEADKGKAVRYRWTSTAPFRLFKRDCTVRVQGWGLPGGYMNLTPFGGPSRVDGAEI